MDEEDKFLEVTFRFERNQEIQEFKIEYKDIHKLINMLVRALEKKDNSKRGKLENMNGYQTYGWKMLIKEKK